MVDSPSAGENAPRRGVWRRLRILLPGLWRLSGSSDIEDIEDFDKFIAESGPFPYRRRNMVLRLASFSAFVLLIPLGLVLGPLLRRWIFHMAGAERVEAEARVRWKNSPHEALECIRSVHQMLREAERARRISAWRGSIEIPPYGRLRVSDRLVLGSCLHDYAFSLGHYEEALAICSEPPPSRLPVSQQVDCLVAMRRTDDAIRVLETHLHLDSRRGDLRKRLAELGGTAGRGLN